jgi:hypothetical protein
MKTVDSIRINFRFFFLSRTSFSYLIEKCRPQKSKNELEEIEERENRDGLTFDDEVVRRAGGAQRRPAGMVKERGSPSSNGNLIAMWAIGHWRPSSPWCLYSSSAFPTLKRSS